MNTQNSLPKNWRKVKLGDFATINPSVQLQRGREYPFLDMADVIPLSRTTNWAKTKVFNGSGARFEQGDTLFARITPCLENGKITQALKIESPGFGSTEFYVLRGKEDVSDSDFVHYLARTHRIRKMSEQSMIGASGRQRVERAAFENIEIEIPSDLDKQKRIASILSAFDDKIELNNKINRTLEAMAQAIFKEWFVDFPFPGHEKAKFVDSELGKIPNGWEVGKLSNVAAVIMGQSPPSAHYNERGEGLPFHQGVTNFGSRFPAHKVYCTVNKRIAQKGDVLLSVRAPVGRINIADRTISLGRGLASIREKKNRRLFIYYLLRHKFRREDVLGAGSVFPAVTKKELSEVQILIPSGNLIDLFERMVGPLDQKIEEIYQENQNLSSLRDLLLPKLMRGEIRV